MVLIYWLKVIGLILFDLILVWFTIKLYQYDNKRRVGKSGLSRKPHALKSEGSNPSPSNIVE
jgi:hypothetical protein